MFWGTALVFIVACTALRQSLWLNAIGKKSGGKGAGRVHR